MQEITNVVEDLVYSNPQLLLAFNNSEEIGLKYLPYSTGFEIECDKGPNFNEDLFKAIPDIMAFSYSSEEQRFRIPNGIKGLICLQRISETLHECSSLNFGSGIHYHIDFTDSFSAITEQNIEENKEWIFKELETWEYKGTYNSKFIKIGENLGVWVRFQGGFKTMEIRIGEMTFDYPLLAKRIIHANKIAKRFKAEINKTSRLERLQNLKNALSYRNLNNGIKTTEQLQEEEIEKIVKSRLTNKW